MLVRGGELDTLLEFLPLKLDGRVVAQAVSMILGEESYGLLIATVGAVPTSTLQEEPDGSLEVKISVSRMRVNGSHGPCRSEPGRLGRPPERLVVVTVVVVVVRGTRTYASSGVPPPRPRR